MKCHYSFLLLLAVALATVASGQSLALHDGDRVVFYGDSITAQRLYTRFAEDFILTRYPGMHVSFFNAGVPGDTAHGGYTGDVHTRLKRDLLSQQPTVVTVMLGMNDGYYMPFNPEYLESYKSELRAIVTTIQSDLPASRITLITPTPYDEQTHGTDFPHYSEVVARHAAFDRELASSLHFGICDLSASITSLIGTAKQSNPSLASLLVPDRIHPGEAVHWVMAANLARAWGVSPTIVSRVYLDAHEAKLIESANTAVDGLVRSKDDLQWTQTDSALPLPLPLDDPMMQFVLTVSDIATMDQQILRVRELSAAHYRLMIDQSAVGTFSRDELAQGVNLALLATPMQRQAAEVDGLQRQRSQLDDAYFILYLDDVKNPADPEAAKELSWKSARLAEQQHALAQPKAHHFALIAQ